MADITNLEDFLQDVADAIKEKKNYSASQKIAAEDFDTEIASIETGIDTSDATAVASDIAEDKTAYVNGQKIVGNISIDTDWLQIDTLEHEVDYEMDINNLKINLEADEKLIINENATISRGVPYDEVKSVLGIPLDETYMVDLTVSDVVENEDNNAIWFEGDPEEVYSDGFIFKKGTTTDWETGEEVPNIIRLVLDESDYSKLTSIIGLTANKIKLGETILGITGTYEGSAMKEYASETAMNNDIANIQDDEVVKVDDGTTVEYYIKEAEIPDTYQPVDLSQYQVGDTISVKNMKIAETWSFTSELASGSTAQLTLQDNNQTVLELQFTGSVHTANGGITIGGTYYACSVANQLDVTVPSADLTTINSDVIWSSDNQLTIASVDNLLGNALLELVQGAPAKMVKLVKETETLSPQEYEEAEEQIGDLLGEEEE